MNAFSCAFGMAVRNKTNSFSARSESKPASLLEIPSGEELKVSLIFIAEVAITRQSSE